MTPREIRRLPEAEVLRQWLALYVAGKHAGQAPSVSPYLGRDATWVEVEIPHDLYNAEWNAEGGIGLSPRQIERASEYARRPGRLPPGIATFSGRRGARKAYVADGNHRAHASYLRGDSAARFYMPANDWERFRAAAGSP